MICLFRNQGKINKSCLYDTVIEKLSGEVGRGIGFVMIIYQLRYL